jgi:two-component system, OmpR family, sensor histidine kinase PhoQ
MFSNSLSTRLLVTVSLLLALFFGVTTVVLDTVFRQSTRQAIRDRLDLQVWALMAATEEVADGRLVPATQLLDTSFLGPNSGLYGQIHIDDGSVPWISPSLLGATLSFITDVQPGQPKFDDRTMSNGTPVLTLSKGFLWGFADGRTHNVVYSVAVSMAPYYAQLRQFRIRLFGGFAVLSVLLVVSLAFLFRSVLKPLRRVETEIEQIEAGALAELGSNYPRELIGVTDNMNTLLRSERERMGRYRNTLGNLAHSLKTPLAVVRNLLSSAELRDVRAARQLDEQVGRMDDIVRYQLKRAAASAGMTLGTAPVPLQDVVQPLVATLQKVYFEHRVACQVHIAPDCVLLADKGDLMELVGNLLDNAFKYCREQVKVSVNPLQVPGSRRAGIVIDVEDDGPGISPDKRQHVLERGTRLDERASGQGIGLSVVRELSELYRGTVEIEASELGGARVTVRLLGA